MLIKLLVFVLLCIGIGLIFDFKLELDPKATYQKIKARLKKESVQLKTNTNLKAYVKELEGKKKENAFKKAQDEAKTALENIGQKDRFKKVQLLALLFAGVGIVLGNVFGNIVLSIVLAGGFYFLPLWLVRFSVYRYTKETNEELAVALSMITTSYIRSNDIAAAVSENLEYMQGAVYKAFRTFSNSLKLNPNILFALENLKAEIDCPLFLSWIDTLIICQEDHTVKYALPAIVRKFSDLRKLQMENETKMMMPIRYAFAAVSLVILFIPGMALLNSEWYIQLTQSFVGQLAVSGAAITSLLMLNKAIKLSGPIEFSL